MKVSNKIYIRLFLFIVLFIGSGNMDLYCQSDFEIKTEDTMGNKKADDRQTEEHNSNFSPDNETTEDDHINQTCLLLSSYTLYLNKHYCEEIKSADYYYFSFWQPPKNCSIIC